MATSPKTAPSAKQQGTTVQIRPAPSTGKTEAASPKTGKATAGGGAARPPAFPLSAKITIVSEANPKRAGTKAYSKWDLYKGCKTVEDVVKAFEKANLPRRKAMSAIRWDSQHKHIQVQA